MALKLDMSKAYDRMEWLSLDKIMRKLGFHPRWVSLIMTYISSVSYSVLVNGQPHGWIKPSRGLCQGDPLSPYVFLMCVEDLHSLISHVEAQSEIQGVSLCHKPKLTHLFFADDSQVFSKATLGDCATIQDILSIYEHASG